VPLDRKILFSQTGGQSRRFFRRSKPLAELPNSKPLPISYAKAFPFSGQARIPRDYWDATILSNKSWLFHLPQRGCGAARHAHCRCFFWQRPVSSPDITKEGDSWVLRSKLEGLDRLDPYPVDQIDPTGNLDKMPRQQSRKSEVQYLESTIKITKTTGGIMVD